MYFGGDTEDESERQSSARYRGGSRSRREEEVFRRSESDESDESDDTEYRRFGRVNKPKGTRDQEYHSEDSDVSDNFVPNRDNFQGHRGGSAEGGNRYVDDTDIQEVAGFVSKISYERDLRPSQPLYDIMIAPFSVGLGDDVCVKFRSIGQGDEGEVPRPSIFELGSMLLVPPKRYSLAGDRSSTHFPIETETKVLEAFESALKTYRANQEYYDSPKTTEYLSPSSHGARSGCTEPLSIDDKDIRFSPSVRTLCVYIWRPSPSLNWRLRGRLYERKTSIRTIYDFGAINHDECMNLLDKADPGDKDVVPKELLVASTCPRLEIIMLAYRYASIILNVANREFNEVTQQDIYNASLHDVKNTLENMRKMGDNLVRAFSMMKNVVEGLVSTWASLESGSKCAETTIEGCHFMQHLIMAMRNSYAIRVQRLRNASGCKEASINIGSIVIRQGGGPFTAGTGEIYDKDWDPEADGDMLEGLSSSVWASLKLGVATSFLKAYQIHVTFIDAIYGAHPWNVGKDGSGEGEADETGRLIVPHIVRQLRNYLEEMILFMLASAFNFSIVNLEFKLREGPIIPKHPRAGGGRTSEEYMLLNEHRRIPQKIFALAQCGLAIIRPLVVGGEKYQCCDSVHELRKLFERSIQVQYPIVTDAIRNERASLYNQGDHSGGLGSLAFKTYANPSVNAMVGRSDQGGDIQGNVPKESGKSTDEKKLEYSDRIADINSLLDYLVVIQSHVSEDKCLYLVEDVSPGYRKYLYKYPLKTERPDLPYLHGACYHLRIPDEYLVRDNNKGTKSDFVSLKEKETRDRWWKFVSSWDHRNGN